MKILFLTIGKFNSINDKGLYPDLLREFKKNGHDVYVVSPTQKREGLETTFVEEDGAKLLKVKIGNITKCGIIEKGISTVLIKGHYKKAIKKYFSNIKFDLILYTTPPITLVNVVEWAKKINNAKTYLLLKDIFPQNAVDLGILKKTGIKGLLYKYFRNVERKLYNISDRIGCMSEKNKEYLLNNNKYIDLDKVEIFPNSISTEQNHIRNEKSNKELRSKYNIPSDAKVFLYGGNLGKPQGIDFIIKCLDKVRKINNCYFVICGNGTDYKKIDNYMKSIQEKNIILINSLPKEEYMDLLNIADVGLIFLDYRFTIPNFPSRTLSYMEKGIPILSCTDKNTDVGNIIEENGFGWKCYSNDCDGFVNLINKIVSLDSTLLKEYGKKGNEYLNKNYSTSINYLKIENFVNKKKIMIVDFAASTGGALSILKDYYNNKTKMNNEYVFLLNDYYFPEKENIKIIKCSKYKSWLKRLKFDYFDGNKYIKKFNPDEILSLQNTIIRGTKKFQTVYVHQAIPFQNIKKFSFFKKREIKLAIIQNMIGICIINSIKKADKVIVQTKWMKKAVVEKCKIDDNKVLTQLPHINLGNNIKKTRKIANQFFYPTSNQIYKNNEIIFEAVKILKDEGINNFAVEMTLVGNSTENIKKIGKISHEDVMKKYCESILIFPSYIETLGLPLIEARECNADIIASDTVFSHEILDDYKNKMYFNPFSAKELAEKMKEMIK